MKPGDLVMPSGDGKHTWLWRRPWSMTGRGDDAFKGSGLFVVLATARSTWGSNDDVLILTEAGCIGWARQEQLQHVA